MAETGPRRLRHGRVRVYETLRTAHLERAHDFVPASIVYLRRNYDFDDSLLAGLDVHHCGSLRALAALVVRSDVREMEVNEPLMLSALKLSLTAALASRLGGLLRGRRTRVVTYALANSDPFADATRRLRSRHRRIAFRLATRVLVLLLDRIAYGSSSAEQQYAALARRRGAALEGRLIPALPTTCPTCADPGHETASATRPHQVLFLGAFDHRKGLAQLLDAWADVAARRPDLTLRVLGKGPLQGLVEDVVRDRSDVSLAVDPSRTEIHAALQASRTLVLLSQPSSTWREQIGLPIVEGLAHGCEIVATDQTGLADWLREHGHQVLPARATRHQIVEAVVTSGDRPAADVVAPLPARDGREEADAWLFRAGGPVSAARRRRPAAGPSARR